MRLAAPVTKYISRDSIKRLTFGLIQEYVREQGWRRLDDLKLDLQGIYECVLYPRFEYEIITSSDLGFLNDMKILGKTIPKERVVMIDPVISPPVFDPRYTFTLGHEFGHGVLHSQENISFRCTKDGIFGTGQYDLQEVQANTFSENLLMPDSFVHAKFLECYHPTAPVPYIGKGKYWFEEYGVKSSWIISSYTDFLIRLARPLTNFFSNVSKTALALKVQGLGLVNNRTRERFMRNPMRIKNIFVEVMEKVEAGMAHPT
jgi:hypothetical protein